MLNENYRDMLRALVDEGVSFLLVGAYAAGPPSLIVAGKHRATQT